MLYLKIHIFIKPQYIICCTIALPTSELHIITFCRTPIQIYIIDIEIAKFAPQKVIFCVYLQGFYQNSFIFFLKTKTEYLLI